VTTTSRKAQEPVTADTSVFHVLDHREGVSQAIGEPIIGLPLPELAEAFNDMPNTERILGSAGSTMVGTRSSEAAAWAVDRGRRRRHARY